MHLSKHPLECAQTVCRGLGVVWGEVRGRVFVEITSKLRCQSGKHDGGLRVTGLESDSQPHALEVHLCDGSNRHQRMYH